MTLETQKSVTLPVGVVIRRLPGVTRWAKWVWKPVAVLPGAPPARWKLLREDGEAAEFHADTVPLTLYRGEAEAYRTALSEAVPCVYVVLRPEEDPASDWPYHVHLVTASVHEGQMFSESGDEIVEKVPMPDGLLAWVAAWVEAHYVEEPFVKRKRRKHRDARQEDGIGDPRISQPTDVYRAPSRTRKAGGS
ncbi:DUF3305 domain-containing protein [Aestuariicoccus sp. MJ-SS9]|uniref:DUF3305 domain-containing protein n=1 Tax=Aestuariicoccus sp. MJ-SS9 TaxID=3079855 RepID=UPI00290856A6|nr:DUF3305 domain-containing protein [Aestuariicoccus sp. MJ-SS9]MDU8912436.1 DUF3305 domain-containing protein [Aestuariicoccus sp. MJ-SS9]